MEELTQATQEMKNGKFLGHDEITVEMIKALSESSLKELLKLLNDVREEKMTLKDWQIGIICAIRTVNNARTIEK